MKYTALGLAAALTVATTSTAFAETSSEGFKFTNPFDVSAWYDASHGKHDMENATLEVDFADPDFWFSFVNPETHSRNHMALTNPETWGQFMNPQTYWKMTNLDTWGKWLDGDSYSVLLEGETYAYWMQPGAYMHAVEVGHYAQMLNPEAYVGMFQSAFNYALPAGDEPAEAEVVTE